MPSPLSPPTSLLLRPTRLATSPLLTSSSPLLTHLPPPLRPYASSPAPPRGYKPYTPKPRPAPPARAPPPIVYGLSPSDQARLGNTIRGDGLMRKGGGGKKGTEDMSPWEKTKYYIGMLNVAGWAWNEKNGWRGLFVFTEFIWLFGIGYALLRWVSKGEDEMLQKPVDRELEWNRKVINDTLEQYSQQYWNAKTTEEKEGIARKSLQAFEDLGEEDEALKNGY